MLRKIRGYENEEIRKKWKRSWTKGSSIILFLAMIKTTRPRMTRWARRSVHKAEKQIICRVVFEKLKDCLTEFGVVSNKVIQ